MSIKPIQLDVLFQKFRGDKARSEEAWIKTAKLISQYVDKVKTVTAIKKDFSLGRDSLTYVGFEAHGQRTLGSLLYGKLALDNYLEGLEGPERELCGEVSKSLGDLYGNPEGNKDKVEPLLAKVNEWLTAYAAKAPNKEEAQALTKGLFTVFSCLHIKMHNISSPVSWLPGVSKLIAVARTELPNLMAETERQAQILEPQVEQIRAEPASKETSMDGHFDRRYLTILSEDKDQLTKLEALRIVAAQTTAEIESLLSKRQEKAPLEENIKKLQALLRAANENDARATGRKYFQEFVTANQEIYNTLLSVHREETKPLETLRTTINQESGGLKSGALSVGSWFTSPLAAVGRKITPTIVSNTLSGFVPDTNDSLAKSQLVQVTTAALADMSAKLKTKNEEIAGLESRLADSNDKLQRQIEKATPDALQKIVTVNTMVVELVDEYKKVRQPIEDTSRGLQKIKQLGDIANDFISINDNALSKVADWFSRFGQWFSTQSLSEKIAESRSMKKELEDYGKNYLAQFDEQLQKLDKNSEISSPVKATIKEQLKKTADAPLSSKQSVIDHFKSLKEGMQGLKTPPETNQEVDGQKSGPQR